MSNRRSGFADGEVLAACSICGRRRLFPSQLAYCPDRLYRCMDACMEVSAMEYDRTLSNYRKRRPEPDASVGIPSQFEPTPADDEDLGFP